MRSQNQTLDAFKRHETGADSSAPSSVSAVNSQVLSIIETLLINS